MESLLLKSMAYVVKEPAGCNRVVLLATVRAYALEMLQSSGEAERVRAWHSCSLRSLNVARFRVRVRWLLRTASHLTFIT
jgi:predicted ATPase